MTVGEVIKELEKYDENLDVADADGFVIICVSINTTPDGENYIQII